MTTTSFSAHSPPPMGVEAQDVHATLARTMLIEGYPFVLDLERSHGQWLYDAKDDREYLDFYSFYASRPIGFNHPKLRDPEYLSKLLVASRCKPNNGDTYTTLLAEFVATFEKHALGPGMKHLFFIDGGALAVENALKAAFDWKARKNLQAGRAVKDSKVIHFKHAFHGRSGYTLSLTNTADSRKTQYYPKFEWPRVSSPAVTYPCEDKNLAAVIQAERKALSEIDSAYARHGADSIACIIVEPLQAEGGDRHMRPQFLKTLRKLCDARESLLIFDEVQTGFGATGAMWYYEQLAVLPDIVAFAKKAQTGGIMASERLDEVESVFQVKSRISSTFGGNLVDFVRCTRFLEIMHEDDLITNAGEQGAYLLERARALGERHGAVENPRGAGLLVAFDVPPDKQSSVLEKALELGLLVLPCGERSIRLRPALDVTRQDCETAMDRLDKAVAATLA